MNTMQFEFDAVVKHLYKQGRPAMDDCDGCLYRKDDGLMCAVGCRIPDDAYDKNMEHGSVAHLVEFFWPVLPKEIVEYECMYAALQSTHDNWGSQGGFEEIEDELRAVAAEYNLTYNDPREMA